MSKKIVFHKNYTKNYRKRFRNNKSIEKRLKDRIQIFQSDPTNPLLKDHALVGDMHPKRSFAITGDIRIMLKWRNIISF